MVDDLGLDAVEASFASTFRATLADCLTAQHSGEDLMVLASDVERHRQLLAKWREIHAIASSLWKVLGDDEDPRELRELSEMLHTLEEAAKRKDHRALLEASAQVFAILEHARGYALGREEIFASEVVLLKFLAPFLALATARVTLGYLVGSRPGRSLRQGTG